MIKSVLYDGMSSSVLIFRNFFSYCTIIEERLAAVYIPQWGKVIKLFVSLDFLLE